MVERHENGHSYLRIPLWVVTIGTPILVGIFLTMITVIQSNATSQTELKIKTQELEKQTDSNKISIFNLNEKKADISMVIQIQNTLTRIENK